MAFFSLLSPPSLKTSPVPGRLANLFFSCLRGLGAGAPIHGQQVHWGSALALFSGVIFPYPVSGHLWEVVAGHHRPCGFILRGFIMVAGQTGPEARLAN